jgi:N-methylhydantoinase A
MNQPDRSFRIAADVGGTFTDLVMIDQAGGVWTRKLPSTPPAFEHGVLHGIDPLLKQAAAPGSAVSTVCHGTTVATNAVLEHRGARTALITTRGFRDVLELRRVRAPQIYDLFFEKPRVIIDRRLRLELTERMSATGEVLVPIAESELAALTAQLRAESVESVAVCLLHSYAFPAHEQQVGRYLRTHLPGVPVSLSCEVLREQREYERTATTAVNAYIRPVLGQYLAELQHGLQTRGITAPLLIMQSAGGLTPALDAAVRPVFVLESGPAAGVLAAWHSGKQFGWPNLISFDMGGTTAKACMIEDHRVPYCSEYEVGAAMSAGNRLVGGGGEMILAPSVDLAEVGAGGGSLAYLDRAGGLHVGPHSAGALPGPACYQRGGTQPTVTDANVVLGYIRTGKLAGGDVVIDAAAAARAIDTHIAGPLGMSLEQAALGIHRIANAHMLRALREVSTQRGRDPRGFVLLAFGGSGPVHAAALARELGIGRVIVPPLPGLFSAVGMLVTGVEHHDVRSCRLHGDDLTAAAVYRLRDEMRGDMLARFRAEACAEAELRFECSADVRYRGQASRLRIAVADAGNPVAQLQEAFEQEHLRLYGHRAEAGMAVEVVAVRLVGRAPAPPSGLMRAAEYPESGAAMRRASFGDPWGTVDTAVVARRSLTRPTSGPLIIDEYDATIVIPPDLQAHVDQAGNLVMEAEAAATTSRGGRQNMAAAGGDLS